MLPSVPLRLFLPGLCWLCVFFLLPLSLIVLVSLCARGPYGGVSWQLSAASYRRLLDPLYVPVLWRSLALAGLATVLLAVLLSTGSKPKTTG